MKIYKTQKEVDRDTINGVLSVDGDVKFDMDFVVIKGDIIAVNINAWDIKAWDIDAGDIIAGDIKAGDIKAGNIDAWNIDAWDIDYYAVCFAYKNITCKIIKGRRKNAKHFCLDGKIIQKEVEK